MSYGTMSYVVLALQNTYTFENCHVLHVECHIEQRDETVDKFKLKYIREKL